MEGEGQRVEAESSSSSSSARVATESSGGLREETRTEDNDDHGDGEEEEEAGAQDFVPSPLISLKDQLEKDKVLFNTHACPGTRVLASSCGHFSFHDNLALEDESLRRWKEKLLGCVDGHLNGQIEPEVTFHSICVISEGCADVFTSLPIEENESRHLFTLKEGSKYRLKLSFSVRHNIVSGLTYSNIVWKRGLKVDQSKGMLGTFAPQLDPYEHLLEEETTPSGVLARGIYTAKLKFQDDDNKCYLELDYSFEIKKR